MKNLLNKIFTVIVVLVLIGAAVSTGVKVIPTGYTGVRIRMGQVTGTIQSGVNFTIPVVETVVKINNKQQDIDLYDRVWSETSERTAIYYEGISITYQISADYSAWLYANVTNLSNVVTSNLVSSAIKSSSKGLSDTDATNRGIIEPLVMENLQKALDEKYQKGAVVINRVTISNVDFDDSYNQAIANRQKAQIEAEQQAIINQQNIDKAKAEAEAKVIQAEADAQAKIIAAEAEAEANRLLSESLTEEILQEMKIEKWNGVLPQVVSDDAGFMIDLGE